MTSSPIHFCLEATVFFKKDSWENFDRKYNYLAGQQARERLEAVGITLIHSMKGTTAQGDFIYYNYWRIGPQLNALPDKELVLLDDPFWAEFRNTLDKQEDKDFVLPLTSVRQTDTSGFDLSSSQYLRIEYFLEHFAVPVLKDRLERQLVDYARARGWLLGNTYLNLTGREARVVQIWLVPLSETLATLDLGHLPWLTPDQILGKPILRKPPTAYLFPHSEFDVDNPVAVSDLTFAPA
jgi:hypothetical protein